VVPELPEVEALAQYLRGRTVGRTVTRVEVAAISALKTFRPPPTALRGGTVVDVARHGKWLDTVVDSPADGRLHLVWHLSRAGWVRWYDALPERPARPGKSPIALRVGFDDGSGFDLTEAGTRKRLAVHVVADPSDVPQIATLGVEPLSDDFTPERLGELLGARNQQVKGLLRDQGTIAGIGNAYSDEILLVARTSPFAPTRSYDEARTRTLHGAIRAVLTEAVAGLRERRAERLREVLDSGRTQADIVRATGKSREAVRQFLDPSAAEAAAAAKRAMRTSARSSHEESA